MNSKTAKLISPERVVELLDCYGADPDSWPDDERPTALALIHNSSELRKMQLEAERLDKFLVSGNAQHDMQSRASERLVSAIIDNLPEQEKPARHISQNGASQSSWSLFGSGNWLGMIAASVAVFVISVSIMELRPAHEPQVKTTRVAQYAQQDLDVWMWEQVTGESDSDDDEPMTMMSFLDMEEL